MRHRQIFTLGVLSALLLGGSTHEGYAQIRQNPHFLPYAEVGFGAGTSTYFGDLSGYSLPIKSLLTLPRWNVGLMYTRHFTPRFSARASFTWARIAGDDYTFSKSDPNTYAQKYLRNLHFRNDLKEFSLIGTYDLIPGGRTPRNRPKFAPYLLFGIALVGHNPKALTGRPAEGRADSTQRWVALQPLGTEGQQAGGNYPKAYSLVTISIPFGVGVRYKLNESFNLAAEVRASPTFTNYLDDVAGPYPNPADLAGNPLSQAFSNRGLITVGSGVALKEPLAARSGDNRQAGFDKIDKTRLIIERGGPDRRIPFLKDSYFLTSFQIHYIIPAKIKCPPIR